jgi:hypothetical protein
MQINPNDIAGAVQVIDLACARGAIRGEEMAQVGALRNNFVKVLESLQKEASAPTEDSFTKDK